MGSTQSTGGLRPVLPDPAVTYIFPPCQFFIPTQNGRQPRTHLPDDQARWCPTRPCGDIIKRFETKGFRLVALKFVQPTEALLKEHYADLSERKFFPGLVKYM